MISMKLPFHEPHPNRLLEIGLVIPEICGPVDILWSQGKRMPLQGGKRQSLGAEGMERSLQGASGDKISYPSGTMGCRGHLPELRRRGDYLKRTGIGRDPVLAEVTTANS